MSAAAESTVRTATRVVLALSVAVVSGCSRQSASPEAPNVILITLDTTRADHLGCYGYARKTSPNIDALAAEGVRFDFAISQSSITPVSCASQLTGTYPFRNGLRTLHGRKFNTLGPEIPTMAEAFRAAGYATAAFVSAFPAASQTGLSRGFDLFDEEFLKEASPTVRDRGVVRTNKSQRSAAQTNAKLFAWLDEVGRKQRFFTWLHYFDPHDTEIVPPEEILRRFLPADAQPDAPETLRAIYDAEVFFADQQIGELLARLTKLGIRDDTLIVVTADHGEGLGDHDWWYHGILYQEQIRVPLVFNGPGVRKGVVVPQLVEHVDLFATLMACAGIERGPRQGVDGHSLLPLLRGGTDPGAKEWAYSESHNVFARSKVRAERRSSEIQALTTRQYKLVHYPRLVDSDALYLLSEDPRELEDLAAREPILMARMLARLRALGSIESFVPDPSTLPADQVEHLRALGYLN